MALKPFCDVCDQPISATTLPRQAPTLADVNKLSANEKARLATASRKARPTAEYRRALAKLRKQYAQ
jgi:hypothetical protein